MPYFITVRNGGAEYAEVVQAGNEGVIRARYADAAYFFKADTAHKLEAFTPRLATLTFQEKLGSMLDKVRRVEQLAPQLGRMLGLSEADLATTSRAASLCKSDLATQMVVEMTSLQGIMGREYARLSGESDAVATAIFEQYLPRFAGRQPAGGPARSDPGAGEPAGLAGRPLRGRPGAHRDGGSVRPAPRCAGPGPGTWSVWRNRSTCGPPSAPQPS